MTARQFWGMVTGNRVIGGIVFAVCVLAALAVGVLSPPLYEATTLFQVSQLADLGSDARAWDVLHSVVVRVNSDLIEKSLAREDVLNAIIARAGIERRITASQLRRHLEVIPAGDDGIYEATAWSPSRADAPRLADATAAVIGEQMASLVRENSAVLFDRLRDTMAELRRTMAEQTATAGSTSPADLVRARAQDQATVDAYANLTHQLTALDAKYQVNPLREAILKPAGPPVDPVTPGPPLYLLFGAVGGAVLGLAATLIRGSLRETTHIR